MSEGTEEPHDWLQNLDIAVEVLCPALAFIVTVLRVYSRLKIRAFGWDDACIVVAMALAVVMAGGTIRYMKLLYVGIHKWDVPKHNPNVTEGMIWIYTVGAVYNPILAIVKQSVLIFLLRLASIKRGVRIVVWVTAVFNAALMIATLLVVILQCDPVALNWDPTLEGSCIDKVRFAVSTACLTIVTDIIALALPFYIFLGLKIDRKKKIGLLLVFLLGIIVTAVGAVRLYFLWPQFGLIKEEDPNYSFSFCVASIEVNLAIIAASGPALWPLLRTVIPRLMTSRGRSTAANKYGYGYGYHQNNNRDPQWTPGGTYRSSHHHHHHVVKGGGMGTGTGTSDSHIRLKDFEDPRSRSRAAAERDSDEEALTHDGEGIQRVVQISVAHDDDNYDDGGGESPRAGSRRAAPDGYI